MTEISEQTYEQLQQILERQNGHSYSLEEAKEIGDGFMDFFALLPRLDEELTRGSLKTQCQTAGFSHSL